MKIKMLNSHFTAKGADLWVYKETNIKVMMALRDAVTYKTHSQSYTTKQM